MIIISDNSALSCLAELGELDLLRQLYGTVVITTTIQREARHSGAPTELKGFIDSPPPWLMVLPDLTPYLPVNHVFVDFENLKTIDGEALGRKNFTFHLILGPGNKTLPVEAVVEELREATRLAIDEKGAVTYRI